MAVLLTPVLTVDVSRWRRRRDCAGAAAAGDRATGRDDSARRRRSGEQMFFDTSLSGVRARCRAPPATIRVTRTRRPTISPCSCGGPTLSDPGTRAVPSLRYQEYTPPYADLLDNPDGISAPGPGGGLTQDGRARDAGRAGAHSAAGRRTKWPTRARPTWCATIQASAYARTLSAGVRRATCLPSADVGLHQGARGAAGVPARGLQLPSIQQQVRSLRQQQDRRHAHAGRAARLARLQRSQEGQLLRLPLQRRRTEWRGAVVHRLHLRGDRRAAQRRTFPRIATRAISTSASAAAPDHPLPASAQYCGMFKTPTLRNVATRKVFFHNGQIKSLQDAIRFYNTRDTNPELWYPTGQRRRAEVERPAGALSRQHRQAGAARRPEARRSAGDVGAGDGRPGSLSEHADRRRRATGAAWCGDDDKRRQKVGKHLLERQICDVAELNQHKGHRGHEGKTGTFPLCPLCPLCRIGAATQVLRRNKSARRVDDSGGRGRPRGRCRRAASRLAREWVCPGCSGC